MSSPPASEKASERSYVAVLRMYVSWPSRWRLFTPTSKLSSSRLVHSDRRDRSAIAVPLVFQPDLLEAGLRIDRSGEIRVLLGGPVQHEPERIVGGEGEERETVRVVRRAPVDAELRVVVPRRDGEREIGVAGQHRA